MKSAKTKEISRSHKVIISKSGLVSVIGGKWTTYRKMAEDALRKIMDAGLLPLKIGSTENLNIHGFAPADENEKRLSIYGSDKREIEKLENESEFYAEKLTDRTNISVAQVIWSVRNEMARTVEDFLARRTRVLFTNSKVAAELAPKVAEIMMNELNQTNEWKLNQINSFKKLAKNYSLQEIT